MGRLSDLFATESASAANACSRQFHDGLATKKGGDDDTLCLTEGLLAADELNSDYTILSDTKKHRSDQEEKVNSLAGNDSARTLHFDDVYKGRITLERYLVQNYLRHVSLCDYDF